MDLAPEVDSIRNQIFHRRRRRPARRWFFLSGIVIGLIWGFAITMALRDMQAKPAMPAVWNSAAFSYVGFEDGRYFIQNRSGKDYRLDPDRCLVFKSTALGLTPMYSKPEAVFIPAGSAAGISFDPPREAEGPLVILDMGGKLRIDLHGGEDALQAK